MAIKTYTITDLRKALSENLWWNSSVIPITKHRALAQVNNPRADESDVVLVVAYEDGEVAGYMGVIPDKIYVSGEERKIGWLSTWWRDPRKGPMGLGTSILRKVLECWQMDIAGRELTEQAGKVYKRLKFIWPGNSAGVSILIRFNSREILPKRFPILRKIRWFFGVLDVIGNAWINLRLSFWRRNRSLDGEIFLEYIREIDNQTKEFMTQHRKKELTRRDAQDLDWMLKFPWVLPAPLKEISASRYFFSSVSNEFQFISVKVFNFEKSMIGFLIFKIRDGHLTLPYIYFDSKNIDQILRVICHHIIALKASLFTTFSSEIIEHFPEMKLPYLYKKERSRELVMTGKFNDLGIRGYHLQDGDADCAFT